MTKPLVTVIIPAFNSAQFLGRCLDSVKKQTYKNIEIIVVDRNSSDGTQEIAKKYTKRVYTHGPERSAQINCAASIAKGKYLYRVDSDFILEPDVIKQCVEKCEKDNLDGIAVHNTSAEGLGFWAEVRKYERNSYKDDNLIVAVRFFTKKALEKVGGFDESLWGPEDYDFHNRFVKAGFKWGRIKAIERHLGEPKSLYDIWKKHFFYGKQMVFYFKKYPSIATKQFIPIRKSYLRNWKMFFYHPLIFFGLIIMIIVKFTAGGLGFLHAFLFNTHSEKLR
ncbi:MAG: glycosyl transferase [Candidatus Levybacteria bacterium RIFCSPHIGHO2_12_FULL_38_12]|nr:MAG: glycosyl transferase [Candidatus Levybacteria bacterium RIFCSPHIGHO2_01_FULL_38_12]OGH21701.1 MAG: glycosyl transferase [Candidatus Levybacteria bacterium RIFCSPHIGHO2_02_FULL_37_18]OGH22641.1 MAG: glycosyl transferase [Candidatus Levybacteria bacterium RIFCSPHIGHO2_12_FULL_38_12]OGH33322.1 MAG: glycosyl transferase [Candidatus Levybacteria bacterium RIFCSPLOWO2_01_FULL_37_20]OGH43711.1 MAG: glycosyl transferase [Candidatus Levybacteria bacterium RIFCSPLOWO2_02_FULL_37_18]OGH50470.1 MA